jgi:transcriptional regulator with XRE-family HTH domain
MCSPIRIESIRIEVSVDDLLLTLTPADVEAALARRLRDARRSRGWTQAELAKRSGLSVATVARLEQAGQGQLSSLLHLCGALGRLEDFDAVLKAPAPASLAELRRRRGRGTAS